jgi:gliding motility-associated-like protein
MLRKHIYAFLLHLILIFSCLSAQAQSPGNCDLFALDAPVPNTRGFFGFRASVSERFAVVGSNYDAFGPVAGKADIYEYTGGVWVHRQTLRAPDTVPFDAYAGNVYIDENTALITANNYTRTGTPAFGRGAVYVYTRQGTQWVQTGFFTNPSSTISGFGWSITKSGTDVAVGCDNTGTQNHAVYVFRQPAIPSQPWSLVSTLTPQGNSNTGYDYGFSLAMEGDNLVVGAHDQFNLGQAAAYFYRRTPSGAWVFTQLEVYPNRSRVGISVGLHGDYAAVSADANGGIRIYRRTATTWQLTQTIYNPDNTAGRFGFGIALNGGVLLVGDQLNPQPPVGAGTVYRYEISNGVWRFNRRYRAPQPQTYGYLGTWVALDRNTNNFILGAPGRNSLGLAEAGQAFVQWSPAIAAAGPFCDNTPAVQLQATAGGGTWSGPGVTNGTSGLFNPSLAGVGTHPVTYSLTAGGCTYLDTVLITVNPRLRIIRSSLPTLTCARDTTITLSASIAGGTWSGNGITNPQTGNFRSITAGAGRHLITYTIPSTNPCGNQDTMSILIRPVIARILSVSPRLTCGRDSTVTLTASPRGGTWQGRGIVSSAIGTFSSAAAGPGRHVVTYTLAGSGSCSSQDTLSIVVAPLTVRIQSPAVTLCRADTILRLAATPTGGLWRGTGITNGPQGIFTAATAGPGRHVLRYELGSGACRAVDSVAITISPVPTPVLSPSSPLVLRCGQSSAVLSITAGRPARASYNWEYATSATGSWQRLTNSNGQPTYAATQAGYYRVQLVQGSCRATSAASEVRVEPVQAVVVPNIFTPNADGFNDLFKLELQQPRTFQLRIFNRWGREVFSTNQYGDFWTGADAAVGVYYYLWHYSTDCETTERVVKGTITLAR